MGEAIENDRNWTATQRKFMQWLSLPSDDRVPDTVARLAQDLGVGEATLYRWQKLPSFMSDVQQMIRDNLGNNAHEVMGAFQKEAAKGSYQHQKTYFEMMGWHTEKNHHEGELTIRVIHVKPDSQQPDD